MTDFERYILARWAYSVGEPVMDDASYNILHASIKARFPKSPYVTQSWSSDPCPVGLLEKYSLKHLVKAVVLSDKTESIPSLNTLIAVKQEYMSMHSPHRLSFKLDGWNIQASYYNGKPVNIQTRGRSTDAMDASVLMPLIPQSIPIMGKVLITMELVVPNSEFEFFKTRYGCVSQRGACSTALAKGGEALQHIALRAHGIRASEAIPPHTKLSLLQNMGFQTPMSTIVNNYEELLAQIDNMTALKGTYPDPTDGLVCEGFDRVRAIRIKGWEEPIFQSYVLGYEEHYGPHAISIQLQIFPIKMANSTQRRLPATNIARIMSLRLMPGAPVAYRIASSAIADIDEEATLALQKQWEGREAEYRFQVEANESLK